MGCQTVACASCRVFDAVRCNALFRRDASDTKIARHGCRFPFTNSDFLNCDTCWCRKNFQAKGNKLHAWKQGNKVYWVYCNKRQDGEGHRTEQKVETYQKSPRDNRMKQPNYGWTTYQHLASLCFSETWRSWTRMWIHHPTCVAAAAAAWGRMIPRKTSRSVSRWRQQEKRARKRIEHPIS